ncbi:AraC family transcriptional regulator [Foetidibacter luteolus]|uniref:AraC family transcriptional regulator n=1 Tax=Foetidibacter luteolus TaxID=2608880 RepID=UPI00129A753F|nr:AraC family transcriptional regulator [Foetidibacter luteolus]
MKPHLLKVSIEPETSFNIRLNKGANFYNQWHFHPEIELIYIHQGRGTRFIGNNVSRFDANELMLIGSNLDHMWRCDPEYFRKDSTLTAEVTVIYFHRSFLGDRFFDSPELATINNLLEKAKRGIKLTGGARFELRDLIAQLVKATGTLKIVLLLTILEKIANTQEKEFVNAMYHPVDFEEDEANRLNRIFHHTLTNFQRTIPLEEIAGIANLTPKAFCRYFKSKTRKTYYNFLLEVRVAHACNLLVSKDNTIYSVCYESGFNNISNFNRYFKKITGKTPFTYRREHYVADD